MSGSKSAVWVVWTIRLHEDGSSLLHSCHTSVQTPPHVPEVRLHLADEAHELWLKTEDELSEIGLPPPFWAFAWAGGQGLARYILDNPEIVRGKTVLDFASGSGFVAIAAKLAGAQTVHAVDIDPWAEVAMRLNAELNQVTIDITLGDMIGKPVPADVILAGDVFYDQSFAKLLIPWFSDLARSKLVLVGDPGRSYCPKEQMEFCARFQVPVTRALEDSEVKKTVVWRFPKAGIMAG